MLKTIFIFRNWIPNVSIVRSTLKSEGNVKMVQEIVSIILVLYVNSEVTPITALLRGEDVLCKELLWF